MSELKYKHNRPQGYPGGLKSLGTVAFEKPHVAEILQELRKQYTKSCMQIPSITVNIGASFLSPGDAFNKAMGRELSSSRIRPVSMLIKEGGNDLQALNLILKGADMSLGVVYTMGIRIYRDSGELRVMYVKTQDLSEIFSSSNG